MKSNSILFLLCIILAIGILICYFIYKSIINRRLKSFQEGHPVKQTRLPSLTNLLLAGIIILGFSYLIMEGNKNDELYHLNQTMQVKIDNLNRELASLKEMLREQELSANSSFSSFSASLSDFSPEKQEVAVSISLALKEDNADTEVSIEYLGETALLSRESGSFKGVINIPLSSVMKSEEPLLAVVKDEKGNHTEAPDPEIWYYPTSEEILEQCFLHFGVSPLDGISSSDGVTYKSKGEIWVKEAFTKVKEANLVFYSQNIERYSYELDPVNMKYDIDQKIPCNSPSDIEIRLEVTDSSDYKYVVICSQTITDSHEDYTETTASFTTVYAKDGNKLYEYYD